MGRAGIQGFPTTPEFFKQMRISRIADLTHKWWGEGKGIPLGPNTTIRVTSMEWADNIFIVARAPLEARAMNQEMTEAIESIGFLGGKRAA